jgi:lipopolysaccharide transport system ATP-binding protein
MSDIVIKAENLGKKYIIGHQAENGRYVALRDVLMQNARTLWNKTKDLATGKPVIQGDTMEEVWALRDVSFEIRRGEAVGIIGRNGAGKSTLLKVLSRITEPTAGRVTIKGRVASLLEIGTGFHPELTGRENIYLNGTIMGMTRGEIKQKFDEIVAFAEVEKYLDTPVKRYSSGMYVRLAFAVAAHLEPEIMIVDEVLAVGDAQFQKKCLGKMGDVANEGRTVLFVSHNVAAITSLCSRSMLLDRGYVKQSGQTSLVVASYISSGSADSKEICLLDHPNRTLGHQQLLTRIRLDLESGNVAYYERPLKLILDYDFPYPIATPQFVISVHTTTGSRVFTLISDYQQNNVPNSLQGEGRIECQIKNLPLLPGAYFISLKLWQPGQKLDEIDNIIVFQVEWLERDICQFNWDNGMGVVYVDANCSVLKNSG